MSDNTDLETALNAYDHLEANLPQHLVKHCLLYTSDAADE